MSDGGGLFVRVRAAVAGGSVSFRYAYRIDGKQKWMTLGSYPKMTLKSARRARADCDVKVKAGIDPALDKRLDKERNRQQQLAEQAAIEAAEKRITAQILFDRWMQLDVCHHKDKGAAVRRLFEKDVLPYIGQLAAEDVKKSHIMAVVDKLLERGVDRMAKVAFSLMRQMFRFGVERDIIDTDPTASVNKSKIGKPNTERDRWMVEDEIRELARKMPGARMLKSTECAIWIALATGCRIGELLKAKWSDIDLEAGTWVIPQENSKNGDALTVYLSGFAVQQFKVLQAFNSEVLWCYPDRSGDNHVCEKTVTKQIKDRQLYDDRKPMSRRSKHAEALKLSGGAWTPHDLRRTAGTMMTALGVLPDIADKCLNHKEQNRIRRTYLRHSYAEEKREAWRLLGERLELLTRTDAANVMTANFQKAAA